MNSEEHKHEKKVTPPEEASAWLPLVHIVIGNMKTFLNGTFQLINISRNIWMNFAIVLIETSAPASFTECLPGSRAGTRLRIV